MCLTVISEYTARKPGRPWFSLRTGYGLAISKYDLWSSILCITGEHARDTEFRPGPSILSKNLHFDKVTEGIFVCIQLNVRSIRLRGPYVSSYCAAKNKVKVGQVLGTAVRILPGMPASCIGVSFFFFLIFFSYFSFLLMLILGVCGSLPSSGRFQLSFQLLILT